MFVLVLDLFREMVSGFVISEFSFGLFILVGDCEFPVEENIKRKRQTDRDGEGEKDVKKRKVRKLNKKEM